MPEEIRKTFLFKRPLNSSELYRLLSRIGKRTDSHWELGYGRHAREYVSGEQHTTDTSASGSLSTSSNWAEHYELTIQAEPHRNDIELSDPLENYFESITLSEPFGWRSGCPTEKDREGLKYYLDRVTEALAPLEVVKTEEPQPSLE